MRLRGLHVHPVKSTAVRPLGSATVLPRGLADDRSWVVVDGDGALVSARELRGLLHVVADTPATDPTLRAALRLRSPAAPDLLLDHPVGPTVPLTLFSHRLQGVPAGAEADAWLQQVLLRDDLRLLWCDDPTRRTLDERHARPGEHTAYADSFPVTLASESSLRRLEEWVVDAARERGEEPPPPLRMEQFRPNLVVDGEEPFAEDHWARVEVGGVPMRVAKPAGRCMMIGIDLDTLQTRPEPVRTLARHRRPGRHTLFAVHLVPELGPTESATLRLGDEVDVTARSAATGR